MAAVSAGQGERERRLREEVREELRHALDLDALFEPGPAEVERLRRVVAGRIDAWNRRAASVGEPPLADPEGLARRIQDEILGLGPLQALLDDPSVEEVIVNGPHRVFAIEGGQKRLTDVVFEDDEELLRLVRAGRRPPGAAAGRHQPHGGRPPP